MPKNKPPAAGKKVKKKALKRLRREASNHNNNYGNYSYESGNCNYGDGSNFNDGQPFDPNLAPGGVLYFQPFNTTTTSSSSITIINNTITTGQQNPAWSPGFQVWEQQYNQDNDMYMPFEWQLPNNNGDNLQGTMGDFWEDESPEAIANPQQFSKQPKKFPKGVGVLKQNLNRFEAQDSAIHSSVFAKQTDVPPIAPRRSSPSTNPSAIVNDNPANPFETVETPSEDTIFQDMLKPSFNLKNESTPRNQLLEMPLNMQIDKLLEYQKMSPEQLRIRWQLAFDLLYLLRYHYPTCEVYGIDSVLTHFKKVDSSCDVQLYVDLTGSELTFEDINSLKSIVQQVKSIMGAHRCPHHGLRSFVNMFIKKERNDKVIQFMHEPSQLTCQLSFQSQLPAKRSQLIRYCSKLDSRIYKFIGVLRYWGQYYGICDTGNGNKGANKISEWALLLLGFVYLMEENKMPPVTSLPSDLLNTPSFFEKGFPVEDSAEGQAVMEFMKGFCEKYVSLDFKAVAVLPLEGQIISRQSFLSSNQGKIPKSSGMAAADAVCIDPFSLSINVFQGKNLKVALQTFQVACKKTLKFLEENQYQLKDSILDLFIARPQPENNTQMITLKMTNDFVVVYMTKLASADKILDSFSSVLKTGMMRNKMFDLWKRFAEEFILEIFPTGLKLPVERLTGGNTNAKGFRYRVSYPFWERMGSSELLEGEDYHFQDPIQVEKIKSTAILVNYLAGKGKHVQTPFQEFWIEMEYKLDVNAEGIHEMQVRLLKIPANKSLSGLQYIQWNDYATVIPAVSRIVERVFQPYLIYKLNAHVVD